MAASNKREDNAFVKCINCKQASAFYQWFENPIIAKCSILNERQVAETKRVCKLFIPMDLDAPEVQHFDSYNETPEEI